MSYFDISTVFGLRQMCDLFMRPPHVATRFNICVMMEVAVLAAAESPEVGHHFCS